MPGWTLLIAAALLAVAGHAEGGRFSADLASCLNRISGYIYNDQFDRAGLVIDSLKQNGEPDVFCHFFQAGLYQAQMMAAESDDLREDYFGELDSLENETQAMLDQGKDSTLAYCFLGHAHAFRSLYYGRNGSILKALQSGLKARNAYGNGYKIDSTFHDLALGLGLYRYWKSVKTKVINWTPLFKNERQNGIYLLHLAADSSEVSSDAACVSLIWVHINEKQYAEAIRLATAMRERYPNGLTFHWAIGEAYYKMEDFRSAIDIFESILGRLKQNPGNYYNIIEASYYLSDCYRSLEYRSPEIVGKLYHLKEEIRAFPIPEKTQKRQKKKIKAIFKNTD
jgi:tetratricopeptide (TPR) repeat protein